jgi:hypothetical protein
VSLLDAVRWSTLPDSVQQPLVLHTWKVVGRVVSGRCQVEYEMVQCTFYGKGPHRLMRACLRAEHGQTAVNGIPKGLNYYVIFILRT